MKTLAGAQTVFLVDGDLAVREELCALLEGEGISTKGYASVEEFLENCFSQLPGCLLLDLGLPGADGIDIPAHLAHSGFALPVICMTAQGDAAIVRAAFKAGALDVLLKPFPPSELFAAVKQAFAQDRQARQAMQLRQSIAERLASLSERERQVMEMVVAGLTNKEIAERLFLSLVTIKLHRGQVMRKMRAETLADLVRLCERLASPAASK